VVLENWPVGLEVGERGWWLKWNRKHDDLINL